MDLNHRPLGYEPKGYLPSATDSIGLPAFYQSKILPNYPGFVPKLCPDFSGINPAAGVCLFGCDSKKKLMSRGCAVMRATANVSFVEN